jgi:hypothetical protein
MKRKRAFGIVCILHLISCGYSPIYSRPASEQLSVALVGARTADAITSDEVVAGVRDTLAKEGALSPGVNYPRVEVEVIRADETSEGIAAQGTPSGHVPRARGTEVGVVARAWIARNAASAHEADTGDVRAFDLVSSPNQEGPLAPSEALSHDDALRATARRVGQRLALRVLGHPAASDEGH